MPRLVIVTALALCCLAWNPTTLQAGYVFMKNGYIIQGKVVEKDDAKIVLRWTNGSMSIEHRFIDQLVLDGSEERELRERAAVQKMAPSGTEFTGVAEENVPLELPPNINEIIALYNTELTVGAKGGVDGKGNAGSGTGNDPSAGEVPNATFVPPNPSPGNAGEVICQAAGFALTPAANWHVLQEDGVVRVIPNAVDHHSVLVIHFQDSPGVEAETLSGELRGALTTNYPGARILKERRSEIGSEPAVVLEGEFPARETVFAHSAAAHDGRCYLFTMILPLPLDTTDRKSIEDCLLSLRFID
ncbi:MAG: hypothetical protein L0Z55_05445 [Planctomycetes bacterium]|nr:hypothetical protein [Planctomycetota bacterium]